MFTQKNIPEPMLPCEGHTIEFGDTQLSEEILPSNQIQKQVFFGNNCGHNPGNPRYYHRPENHKRRPSVLEQAITALTHAYHKPKKFLKSFNYLNNRAKRSERREAVISVAQVLCHFTELSTLRTGFFAESRFIDIDLEYIAGIAGINLLRARRAVSDLVKAGYVKVSRQYTKKEDGSFAGVPSIREISMQFFIDLGIQAQNLFFTREWKRKKDEKKVAKKNKGKLTAVVGILKSVKNKVIAKHNGKALIAKSLELHRANPEKSPSQYLKELQTFKE